MQTVEFKFAVGDTVHTKTGRREGTVIGNFIGLQGQKEVYVEYCDGEGRVDKQYFNEEMVL